MVGLKRSALAKLIKSRSCACGIIAISAADLAFEGASSVGYRVLISRARRFNVRWLCLRPPEQLDEHERQALRQALANDERIARGYELLQRFRRLVARRSVRDLDRWLEDAAASGLPPFVSLVRGITTDRVAVNAGLTLLWSTGPVEAYVTKVKLLNRAGYGRQSTQLLRRRVVSAA